MRSWKLFSTAMAILVVVGSSKAHTLSHLAATHDSIDLVQLWKASRLALAHIERSAEMARHALLWEWTQQRWGEADQQRLLQEQMALIRKLEVLDQMEALDVLKIRFERGIDLVKLLYEKILSLDHHFAGMRTYQNIHLLSNPNSYPEFQQTQSLIEEKLRKKNSLVLPNILNTNPFLSATFSMVASLIGEGDTSEKQQDLDKISCILDFTVRMRSDLTLIQHETEYLKTANQQLKAACESLFEDYVKVIDYYVPLDKCRNNDDWEAVYRHLEAFLERVRAEVQQQGGAGRDPGTRAIIDLEFATQQVADFISSYNQFIIQGIQYYQKFDNIVSTYEHEADCQDQLPRQFEELKYDIKSTIEKFENTYHLPEIQGSRMKNLLYGNLE